MKKSVSDMFCVTKNRSYLHSNLNYEFAFTIVELLVVIVVIGILATITIVSYAGIQSKAVVASLASDLNNASQQLKMFQIDNSSYPTTIDCGIPDSASNKCIKASDGITYQYNVDASNGSQAFCISATKSSQTYAVSQDGIPMTGDCINYGLILHWDAGNLASYSGSGTSLSDLSSNNNIGTLNGGTAYGSSNGGYFTFDAIDDYIMASDSTSLQKTSKPPFSVSFWVYPVTNVSPKRVIGKGDGYSLYGGWHIEQNSGVSNMLWWSSKANRDFLYLNLTNATWTQVTIVHSGSMVKIYLNGVLSTSKNTSILPDGAVGYNFYLGRSTVANYSNVSMSSVRAYNRVLTASESLQLFNTLKVRYGI